MDPKNQAKRPVLTMIPVTDHLVRSCFLDTSSIAKLAIISKMQQEAVSAALVKTIAHLKPTDNERRDRDNSPLPKLLDGYYESLVSEPEYLNRALKAINIFVRNVRNQSQEGWRYHSETNGVKVSLKEEGGLTYSMGIGEFEDICADEFISFILKGPVTHRLYDPTFGDDHPVQNFGTVSVTKVQHSWFHPIWPVGSRDFSMMSFGRRLNSGQIALVACSAAHPLVPEKEGRTRAYLTVSGFIVEELKQRQKGVSRIRVSNILMLDPMGGIPKVLVNTQAKNRPLQMAKIVASIKSTRTRITNNKYGIWPYIMPLFDDSHIVESSSSTAVKSATGVVASAANDGDLLKSPTPYTSVSSWFYMAHALMNNPANQGALPIGTLRVKVIEATGLKPMDLNGLSDPFLVMAVGPAPLDGNSHRDISTTGFGHHPSRKYKTTVVNNTLNPKWNDDENTFLIDLRAPTLLSYLRISLFDHNSMLSSVQAAETCLPLHLIDIKRFRPSQPKKVFKLWLPFYSKGSVGATTTTAKVQDQLLAQGFRQLQKGDSSDDLGESPAPNLGSVHLELSMEYSDCASFFCSFLHTEELLQATATLYARNEDDEPAELQRTHSQTSLEALKVRKSSRLLSLVTLGRKGHGGTRRRADFQPEDFFDVDQFCDKLDDAFNYGSYVTQSVSFLWAVVNWVYPLWTLVLILAIVLFCMHPALSFGATVASLLVYILLRGVAKFTSSSSSLQGQGNSCTSGNAVAGNTVTPNKWRETIAAKIAEEKKAHQSDTNAGHSEVARILYQYQLQLDAVLTYYYFVRDVLSWRKTFLTHLVIALMIIASAVIVLVPNNILLMIVGIVYFTRKTAPVLHLLHVVTGAYVSHITWQERVRESNYDELSYIKKQNDGRRKSASLREVTDETFNH